MFKSVKTFLDNLFLPRTLRVAKDIGSKSLPVIVLLHGIAATAGTWDLLIKEIDISKYRVVALDLLGFGMSPKPSGCKYFVEDHVAYVHRTIRKLKIKSPYIVVGHSMGSVIAARYCRIYFNEVKAAYLLSLPLYIDKPEPLKRLVDRQIDIYFAAYRFLSENKDFTINNSQNLRKLLRVYDGMDVTEDNWEGFRLSLKNTIINQDVIGDIENARVPINIYYGDLDELLPQKSIDNLASLDKVKVTRFQIVGHLVGTRFAKLMARIINEA
jgi:pimeloyl-ACP methyl ester carboxylesterase